MPIIDLTFPSQKGINGQNAAIEKKLPLSSSGISYTGMIYDFCHDSMLGTYIDFPGHILETDDGADAENYPVEKLYRINAAVVRLNRENKSGGVSANELEKAFQCNKNPEALIVNALGEKRFDEIDERSVWLDESAIEWIIARKIHLFVSDIYESKALHGVFFKLFESKISTVCCPVNLHKLPEHVKISVFFLPIKNATQIPCRLIAEF